MKTTTVKTRAYDMPHIVASIRSNIEMHSDVFTLFQVIEIKYGADPFYPNLAVEEV